MKAVQFVQRHRLSPLATAVSLALLAPACLAQAQQAPQDPQRESRANASPAAAATAATAASATASAQAQPEATLQTIVVTANKRQEKLMDVPAAITVVDKASMDRTNTRGMDDLPSLSPALTISYSTQPANNSINMRGIGTFSFGIGVESDVAVIVDDIPLAYQAAAFKDLTDVSRIEVLKGPQSTLFGKSAIAGAINITTTPIQAQAKTSGSVTLTNDGEHRESATVSGALSDKLRMRLTASNTDFPGTVKNLTSDTHLNGDREQTLIGKVEWAPSDDVTVTLSPHYNHSVVNCCIQPFTSMTPGGQYGLPPVMAPSPALPANLLLGGIAIGPNNVSVRNDYPTGGTFHDYGSGMKVDFEPADDSPLAGYTLSSITSFDKYHMNDYQDGDGTDWSVMPYIDPNGPFTGGLSQFGTFDVRSVTQEFRVTSPEKRRLRYVAGLWFGKNDLARALKREPVPPYSVDFASTAFNTTYAVFGQGTFDITDNTSLVGGLRLNKEDTGYQVTKYTNPPAAEAVTGHWSGNDSEDSITGRVGLEHRLNKDVMVYGTYSTGHKGKAYDLTSSFSAVSAANQPIPGEKSKDFEVGMKAMLLDNRAALSVDAFKTDFYGFQQSAGQVDDDGVFRTQLHSIGKLRTSGIEAEGSFRVSRAFLLNGNLAFMRAIIAKFPNGPCYNVLNATGSGQQSASVCAPNPTYGPGLFQDLGGKTLPNAPRFKANVGGQYDIALASQSFDLFATSDYRWQSATQFSLNQDPGTIQKAYGILDAGFGMKDKNGAYKLSFFVKNLLDNHYAEGMTNLPRNPNWSTSTVNVSSTQWIPPRDYTRYYGMRLDVSY